MAETVIEIEGPDGELFPILGPDKGSRGITLGKSPEGVYEADPTEALYVSHAYQRGATLAGIQIGERNIKFKAHVVPTEYQTWQQNASDWIRAFDFEEPSKLWLSNEYGRKYLECRLKKSPSITPDINPDRVEYAEIGMELIAGDPSWRENDVKKVWQSTVDTLAGNTFTKEFEVSNPTDTPMWLTYVLQAYPGAIYTLPDYSFGSNAFRRKKEDAKRVIKMPALLANEHLKVNTSDEEMQVESDLDTQVYIRMDGWQFLYPIPPNTKKTKLPISVTKAPAGVGVQIRMPKRWSNVLVV